MSFTRIQLRRGTAADWVSADPVLAEGEIGLELDTDQFKVGDGLTAWSALPYGGMQGPAGPDGPVGATGPAGPQGEMGAAGPAGDTGPAGPAGPQGDAGPAGPQGDPGATWHDGTTDPAPETGADGDYYLNATSGEVFAKAAGTWSLVGSIEGPQGPAGPQGVEGPQGPAGDAGPAGLAGSTWHDGASDPLVATGVDGDYYLNTSSGDVFSRSAGSWLLIGNIAGPVGPAGVDGLGWTGAAYDVATGVVTFTSTDGLGFSTGDLRGADGAQGPAGPQGPAGADGAAGPTGPQGDPGAQGPAGEGVPSGGASGQVLAKASATDYDTAWVDLAAGSSSLGALSDVGLTSPADDDVLAYDTAAGEWINQTAAAAGLATAAQGALADSALQPGTVTVADITDISAGSASANDVLVYNSLASAWSSSSELSMTAVYATDTFSIGSADQAIPGQAEIRNSTYSSTAPHYSFRGYPDTGYGLAGPDTLSLITGGSEATRIDASGNLCLTGGNGDGKGINFGSSTANAATTLDYYEEGVWSPGVRTQNNDGSYSLTVLYAHYVRIGKLVFLSAQFNVSCTTIGTGNQMWITGLPFPGEIGKYAHMGIAYNGSSLDISGFLVSTNLSVLRFLESGNRDLAPAGIPVGSHTNIIVSGCYTTQ